MSNQVITHIWTFGTSGVHWLPGLLRALNRRSGSVSQRSASSCLIVTVTSRDGQRGLTVVTLSWPRPRLAGVSGLSPDREVPR